MEHFSAFHLIILLQLLHNFTFMVQALLNLVSSWSFQQKSSRNCWNVNYLVSIKQQTDSEVAGEYSGAVQEPNVPVKVETKDKAQSEWILE